MENMITQLIDLLGPCVLIIETAIIIFIFGTFINS